MSLSNFKTFVQNTIVDDCVLLNNCGDSVVQEAITALSMVSYDDVRSKTVNGELSFTCPNGTKLEVFIIPEEIIGVELNGLLLTHGNGGSIIGFHSEDNTVEKAYALIEAIVDGYTQGVEKAPIQKD